MSRACQRFGNIVLFCVLMVSGNALAPLQASAQTAGHDGTVCECVTDRNASGVVSQIQGRVLATQRNGLVPVKSPVSISVPGRVVAGPQSSAVVALGKNCVVRIPADSSAEIKRDDGRLCLALLSDGAAVVGGSTISLPVVLTLGGVAVGGVILAISDDDKPVSR